MPDENDLSATDDGSLTPDSSVAEEMSNRRVHAQNLKTTVFGAVQGQDGSPIDPVRLTPSDRFKFRCHRGVSCWNVCCHGADVTLTPCDILTLSRHFGMRPAHFVKTYTVPAIHEGSGLPVPKLVMTGQDDPGDGKGPCVFMDDEAGCTVYDSRPVTCRYYPMGLGAIKMKGHETREDMYFLVKEAHCKGHFEDKEQSVAEFRKEQGVEPYDLLNERWVEILMKMASWRSLGGPMGRDVTAQTKKMFYMVSTDIDTFRMFVFGTKFLDTYDIDDDMVRTIETNDEALLQLGFDWLRNVMFNEPTIAMKQEVLQQAIGTARENLGGM